jgi:hypothetical protein
LPEGYYLGLGTMARVQYAGYVQQFARWLAATRHAVPAPITAGLLGEFTVSFMVDRCNSPAVITRLWAALSRLADVVEGYGAPHTESDRRQLKRLREALEKRFPVQPRGCPELSVRSAETIVRALDLSRIADLLWAARFLLIYFTGMRCGETAANTLRLSDLSLGMVAGKVDHIMVESGNTKARKKTAEPELKFVFPRASPLDPVGVLVRYLCGHHKCVLAPGPLAVRGTAGACARFPSVVWARGQRHGGFLRAARIAGPQRRDSSRRGVHLPLPAGVLRHADAERGRHQGGREQLRGVGHGVVLRGVGLAHALHPAEPQARAVAPGHRDS